jgi:hypothetical protein
VLAATGNSHYNSMVCNHFAPHLGRHRVFQPYDSGSEHNKRVVSETRRGITAFSGNITFAELWTRMIRGWSIRKTVITETYTEKDFLAKLADDAIRLAIIPENGKLEWLSQTTRKFQTGDTVISFVPPEPELAGPDAMESEPNKSGPDSEITPKLPA